MLCLTCSETPAIAGCDADPLSRMERWQQLTARFWGENRTLFLASKSSMLWLALAMVLAYVPETRMYAVYPVIAAVLLMSLREFIPIAPTPFGTNNTVTSTWGAYATAAMVAAATLMLLGAVGSIVAFAERLGNAVLNKPYHTFWDQHVAWVTAAIVVAPTAYFAALAVSNRFVDKVVCE